MRIVVIGSNGFIGTNLVIYLSERGYSIIACDSRPPLYQLDNVVYEHIIIPEQYRNILNKDDCVIYLSCKGMPLDLNKEFCIGIENNIYTAIRTFEICSEKGVTKIIYASSGGAIYGIPEYVPIDEGHSTLPISAYGVQKLTIEHYLRLFKRLYGLHTISMRISNPYGPGQTPFRGQGVIATYLASGILNQPIEVWGDGNEKRDYFSVLDLVKAFESIILYDGDESAFNIGSGEGISLIKLISIIEDVLGKKLVKIKKDESPLEVQQNYLSCKKADEILKWKCEISLIDGIKLMNRCWNSDDFNFTFRNHIDNC